MLLYLLNVDSCECALLCFWINPRPSLMLVEFDIYLIFEDPEQNNIYLASLSCDLGLGHWHWLEILQDSLLEDLEEFWPLVIKRKV